MPTAPGGLSAKLFEEPSMPQLSWLLADVDGMSMTEQKLLTERPSCCGQAGLEQILSDDED